MIVGSKKTAPFLFRGTGLIADKENPLVLEVLTASSTAYSYKPDSPIEEVISFFLFSVSKTCSVTFFETSTPMRSAKTQS